MNERIRLRTLNVLLALFSLMIGYGIIEITLRIYLYGSYYQLIVKAAANNISGDRTSNAIFDQYTGYKYKPNLEVGPISEPFPIHYKTNSHGLIARNEIPIDKPVGNFRIGVVGDSFTAGVMSTVRWSDVLEDLLNKDKEWRGVVRNKHTTVINFGLDGAGTVQFDDVVERVVLPYKIDFLIVNMLREDVIRRHFYRAGHLGKVTDSQITRYTNAILSQLPWFGIYPEALAFSLGHKFGLKRRLSLENHFSGKRFFDTSEEAAIQSNSAIVKILDMFPGALLLIDPTYKEHIQAVEPFEKDAFEKFMFLDSGSKWIDMNLELPAPKSREDLNKWFNVPYDQHKNALGTKLYGEAVTKVVIRELKHK